LTRESATASRRRALRASRRRFLLLSAGVATVLLLADWFAGGITRGWVYGRAELTIESQPTGATLIVDGEARGETPITLTLEPGHHRLLVEHRYHPRQLDQVTLERAEHLTRTIVLEPAYGRLRVVSNPKGAQVRIDGEPQPHETPLELDRVQAGVREVTLRLAGRTPRLLSVEVLPDTLAEATAELEPARTGTLQVRVTPTDAKAELEDEFGERHPAGSLVPFGPYTLTVERDGYRPSETRVNVNQTSRTVEVVLEPLQGTLTLSVNPPDARVTVTPAGGRPQPYRAGMPLSAGPVVVEARAQGHRTARRTIRITEGANTAALQLHRIQGRAGDRIRDTLASGGEAPALVVVPAGSLQPATTGQRQISTTRFEVPYAIGMYEVTRGDWARFTTASHRPMPPARPGETDTHPVVGVRFDQAVAYADWLSQQTGQRYRLPSEAEWEYAARAGQSGLRPGNAEPAGLCALANLADATLAARFREWETVACDDGYEQTAPVGGFPANPWGLHDTLGNAAEWTATCWDSKPGTADPQHIDCGSRVVRGGSWDTAADGISFTAAEPAGRESDDRGFRLLREL